MLRRDRIDGAVVLTSTESHCERETQMSLANVFNAFARWTSRATGQPAAFVLAAAVIVVWAITGPLFHFSDTWQLVINTGTTVVTFLMVFLIQNTQNRDSEAMHLKLDALICALKEADNAVLDLEEMTQNDLDKLREPYEQLAKEARATLASAGTATRARA
jgi:low affinity Fe/Cu permease